MDHALGADHAQWGAMAEYLELEGEVLLPLVTRIATSIAEMTDHQRRPVRKILDVGSGPGVGACELARIFPGAAVVAVDASPAMLERVTARAARTGLSARVSTHRADASEGLERVGRADIVWAAMLLHHVSDASVLLRGLRRCVADDGLLVVVEHGHPTGFLPDEPGVGCPGLADRLASADEDWLSTVRRDYAPALAAAGFDVVMDDVVRVTLEPPLSMAARRVLLRQLGRIRHLLDDGLDHDPAAIAVLLDEQHPLGIMRRPDVHLDASRRVYVARAA